jgi:hypothetical protein
MQYKEPRNEKGEGNLLSGVERKKLVDVAKLYYEDNLTQAALQSAATGREVRPDEVK